MLHEHSHKIFMIIDDDKDDIFFFRDAVKKLNPKHICLDAIHGEDALNKLMGLSVLPDYIFLDLNMPVMNGVTCLKELKHNEKFKNIPVIIYSTSSYIQDKKAVHALGACCYIVKKMDIDLLPDEIAKAMQIAESYVL